MVISGRGARCAIRHVPISSSAPPPARSRPIPCLRCIRRKWSRISAAAHRPSKCAPRRRNEVSNAPIACFQVMSSKWVPRAHCSILPRPSTSKACIFLPAKRLHVSASIGACSSRRRGRSKAMAAAWCAKSPLPRATPVVPTEHCNGGCSVSPQLSLSWIFSASSRLRRRFQRFRFRAAAQGH